VTVGTPLTIRSDHADTHVRLRPEYPLKLGQTGSVDSVIVDKEDMLHAL